MDRPERPDRSEPASIFSRPDPNYDPIPHSTPEPTEDTVDLPDTAPSPGATQPPEPAMDPLDVSTWGPPARPEPDAYSPRPRGNGPRPPSGGGSGPSRPMLIGGAALGVLAVGVLSFVAFTVLGGDETPPPVAGGDVSPTPSASTPEPTVSATPEATAEPTPVPTPAGPPAEVAVGGWATVAVDELNVRSGAGEDEPSSYTLVRQSVVNVLEGPTAVDGRNWYRVASLGGAVGWASSGGEEDPFLETVAEDGRINECGQVRRPVFDGATGTVVAVDPLRIGQFALPVAGFDDLALATMELSRGMGHEVCFSARLGPNGMPELSTQLGVSACGHATYDGSIFRLEPTGDDSIPLASQVIESTILHPVLLAGGPADHRMSSNFATVVRMMTNDGTNGCLNLSVTQRAAAIDSSQGINANQCSRVNEYNKTTLKLSPAPGGPQAFIKLSGSGYFDREQFPLEKRLGVSVDIGLGNDGSQWANAYASDVCS
jgi:Bacterial SH3 domain